MLTVTDLTIHYGKTCVIDSFNLHLSDNDIVMLVGPTGCGKTTLLHALAGLIPISSGKIATNQWESSATIALPPERRNVGMVFQDFALFPHLTVQQNVFFRLKNEELGHHWLHILGLDDFRDVLPSTLSGGQKQRVALARAIAHEPALILLDEPLSSLDAALKDSLRWEIRDALKQAKIPAVWVTHDQSEALTIGDRIGILNNGKLEQLDTPENCYSLPASRFVAGFLGEASYLKARLYNPEHRDTLTAKSPIGDVTCLLTGDFEASNNFDEGKQIALLVRPDDLSLSTSTNVFENDTNCTINWVRYEGESRLYGITLDSHCQLVARVNHENIIKPKARARVWLTTTHPLAAFI